MVLNMICHCAVKPHRGIMHFFQVAKLFYDSVPFWCDLLYLTEFEALLHAVLFEIKF